jgi:hypothetical protein
MKLPGFTAEVSLGKSTRTYHGKYLYSRLSQSQSGLPAGVLPNQLEDMEGLADMDEANLIEEFEAEDLALEELEGMEELDYGDEADLMDEAETAEYTELQE